MSILNNVVAISGLQIGLIVVGVVILAVAIIMKKKAN